METLPQPLLHRTSNDTSKRNAAQERPSNTPRIPKTPQGIQRRKIPTTPITHNMGSRNRTIAWGTSNPPGSTPPPKPKRTRRDAEVCRRTSEERNHSRIVEPLCSKLLLHQKERWKAATSPRLQTHQQMDEEKQKRLPTHPTDDRSTQWMQIIHQVQRPLGIQQYLH